MIPHYLRFARAVALVSVALPMPVLAGECLAGCVGGPSGPEQTSSSGSSGSGTSSGGTSSGGTSGEPPTLGVVAAPSTGIVSPPGVRVCPSPCNASDAGGDGGPAFGLPELPEEWEPRSVSA